MNRSRATGGPPRLRGREAGWPYNVVSDRSDAARSGLASQSITVLILALDTTTRAGSCALWRDGVVLEARAGRPDLTHAQRLPGDLAALLEAHGVRPADVDLYAVASGPGSFTGLRVGIATMQALALVHDRLVVPITALSALGQYGARLAAAEAALSAGSASGAIGTIVGGVMEAYRGEVFGALYRVAEARGGLFALDILSDASVAPAEALSADWAGRLAVLAGEMAGEVGALTTDAAAAAPLVIGDGVPASEAVLRARWPDARLVPEVPLAGLIAEMAAADPGQGVHPHAIVPVYVRRTDAELLRERQLAADPPAAVRAPSC